MNGTFAKAETSKRRRGARRGFVLVAVIVLLSVCVTLFGVWARAVLRERGRVAGQQTQAQAVRLAEAGLHRAIIRRAADAQYEGETWSVPAVELDKSHAAEVRIQIAPDKDGNKARYVATAEYPAGELRRAQITKSIELPNPVAKE